METRRIGSVHVSVVGLGCNNFGSRLDLERTRSVVDAALDCGVTFLDTADAYGGTQSEEFLGRALEGRRDRVVIATKFGMEVDAKRKGAKPAYVRRACEDSLKRLSTDRIDLYQLHRHDPETPIADTLAECEPPRGCERHRGRHHAGAGAGQHGGRGLAAHGLGRGSGGRDRATGRRVSRRRALGIAALVLAAAGCARPPQAAGPPVTREFTVTTIPLLTKEMWRIYPFLAKDFAPGGVLEGKEVYAFEPSSITVYEGDTVRFTLINPEDDVHSFVLPDLSVALPPQSRVSATWIARAPGSYRYVCAIPSHLPFMYGTLTVLPARDRP